MFCIGVSLDPHHEFPDVAVVLLHNDCPPIFAPTILGSTDEVNQHSMLRLFHLQMHTIIVCQDVMGPIGKNPTSMFVLPSHANDHGHNFLTLLMGTYHVVELYCLVVLRPIIFMHPQLMFFLFDGKTFDEDLLSFTPLLILGVASLPLSPMCPLCHCHHAQW